MPYLKWDIPTQYIRLKYIFIYLIKDKLFLIILDIIEGELIINKKYSLEVIENSLYLKGREIDW